MFGKPSQLEASTYKIRGLVKMGKMEQTIINLSAPHYRVEIKDSLEYLADYKKLQQTWFENSKKYPHAYWDSLVYYVFSSLYEDSDLHIYKEDNIGKFFYNKEEAINVWRFCKWFHELTEIIGEDKPDAAYLHHEDWSDVYEGAEDCFMLMDKNDKKYNFSQCLEEFNNKNEKEWLEKNK